jgi:NAD(P)-dependent dehydrogenase (short-subunit alcohol dehydrogenase family)
MITLKDKVLLITGAARGIGAACARTGVRTGARVVIVDVLEAPLRELADELGDSCRAIVGDLADPSAVPDLWARAMEWQDRIDVLINNAGIYEPASVDDAPDAWLRSWQRTLAINLVSPGVLCREAVRSFRETGGGTIVNVASRAAFRGEDPEYMHYAASKAGVVAMTRTIARMFGRDGIVAVAIAPGFVRTELNRVFFDRRGVDAAAAETALGAIAEPQDIANTIIFIASGLARHATGATWDLNGASYVR